MKRISVLLLVFLLTGVCVTNLEAQEVSLMSFNIRYDNPQDGIHRWDERKSALVNFILEDGSDIIGLQEALSHQLEYMDSCMLNYAYVGEGRDDGKLKGEFCAVFYDSSRFEVESHETFWLSETPEEVSVGWTASMERICTQVLFREKLSGKQFYVYNLHLDHLSAKARRKSVKLVIRRMKETKEFPCILMGDFNAIPQSRPIRCLNRTFGDLKDARFSGPEGTFQNFGRAKLEPRIDYIFSNAGASCLFYEHLKINYSKGRYLSDHRPVKAVFNFELH